MENSQVSKKIIEEYVKLYDKKGKESFYKYIVGKAIISIDYNKYPENDLLNHSNYFFSMARSQGDDKYFIIGKILRRSAHKVYRALFAIDKDKPINSKFLNLLK